MGYNLLIKQNRTMRLKNILLVALAFMSITTFTGCINIVEEIFLKKNGSGKYTMQMDMSGLLEMAQMMSAMGGEDAEEGEGDPFAELGEKMDSTFYFKDADSDFKKQFADNPDILDRLNFNMKLDKDENEFLMNFNLNFKNMDDIEYFYNNMDKIMAILDDGEEEGEDMLGGMGGGGLDGLFSGMGSGGSDATQRPYDYKKCTLTRHDTSQEDAESMEEELDEEELQMMKMMFGNANYTTIYHLPGKVKKMTNADAQLSDDKKTVTLEGSLIDYMEGKLKLDNTIKFGK